jgi:hypothetical protein
MMKYQHLLVHFLLFLAPMVVAQTDGLQDKAESQGAGGNGSELIEPRQCLSFDDASVKLSAAKTVGQCKTNSCSGCCRFHTAFLTCDTKNTYRRQQCVCNERTNNADRGATTGDTTETATATGDATTGTEAPTGGTTTGSIAIGAGISEASTCANGSIWQESGFSFKNCASGAQCAGINTNAGTPTCCKKSFCWCGSFEVASEECVA